MDRLFQIALYGDRGSGKTTAAQLIEECLPHITPMELVRLQMAAPLYALQREVYLLATGKPPVAGFQDEELLASLAGQFRRIDAKALVRSIEYAVQDAQQWQSNNARLILVEDSRPIDRAALAEMGFQFVRVNARDDLRRQRLQERGDAQAYAASGEVALVAGDRDLVNNASLEAYRAHIVQLLKETVVRDSDR